MQKTERALDGKIAIITEAGRGIGKAIAIAYADAGAAVCCAARADSQITTTVEAIKNILFDYYNILVHYFI
jgi:3-oxoacyl-[acyl-carrier protein] reductase